MRIIIFEDDHLVSNFTPLTLTRPVFELTFGAKSILQNLLDTISLSLTADYALKVRPYLKEITQQRCRGKEINPSQTDETTLFINALVNPEDELFAKFLERDDDFAAFAGKHLALAKLSSKKANNLLLQDTINSGDLKIATGSTRVDIPESTLTKYLWQLIERNPDAIKYQAKSFSGGDDRPSLEGCSVLGRRKNLLFQGGAHVEPSVTFDVRGGPILIGVDAEIRSFSRIEGPVYIGSRAQIRSAKIGVGTSIGDQCRIGGEIESSIIDKCSNKAHDGFIGHSYIGEWVNIGAGTSNSDLKNTYGTIKMNIGDLKVNSGNIKIGCFIADYAKTSIGCFIYTGKRIGVSSQIHGYVTEDVPSFTIYMKSLSGKCFELTPDSASETQKRMMVRRGVEQTEHDKSLLTKIFEMTQKDRYSSGVLKSRFTL